MISHNAMKKFWLNCMLLSIMHSQLKLDLPSIFWGRFREIESNPLYKYIHILLQLQWFGHWHYRLCDSSINRFICNVLRFFFLKFSTMSKLKSGQVYYKLTQLCAGTFPRLFWISFSDNYYFGLFSFLWCAIVYSLLLFYFLNV